MYFTFSMHDIYEYRGSTDAAEIKTTKLSTQSLHKTSVSEFGTLFPDYGKLMQIVGLLVPIPHKWCAKDTLIETKHIKAHSHRIHVCYMVTWIPSIYPKC